MDDNQRIAAFLDGASFAVVGASRDRSKYGNKVLRAYLQHDRSVFAVNPSADEIEGVQSYASLASIPVSVHGVSIITPPAVTSQVVDEAIALGIRHLWMQPGAEDAHAVARAEAAGINVIANGPCVLVVMDFREA